MKLETAGGDGAVFDCHPDSANHRYRLWRLLDNRDEGATPALFVMLNPSTARHDVPDPTITRCVGFARTFGASRLEVVNLFSYRATKPRELALAADPVGPDSDRHIVEVAEACDLVVCAWGTRIPRGFESRAERVQELLREAGHPTLYCLGETKAGHPKHPLYLAATTPLEVFAR